jgi:hypothetical protein
MKMPTKKRALLAALALTSVMTVIDAQASVITYEFKNTTNSLYLNNSTQNTNGLLSAPINGIFATATFTDVGTGNTKAVELTLAVDSSLASNAYVDNWTFNLVNGATINSAIYKSGSNNSSNGTPSSLPATTTTSAGSGRVLNGGTNYTFDFGVAFSGSPKELNLGSSVTYTLSNTNHTLSASDFLTSDTAGLYAAVHVGGGNVDSYFKTLNTDGIATTNSVPEPATLSVLGLGLAALGASRRRKSAAK